LPRAHGDCALDRLYFAASPIAMRAFEMFPSNFLIFFQSIGRPVYRRD
jgi:hypothetical protein